MFIQWKKNDDIKAQYEAYQLNNWVYLLVPANPEKEKTKGKLANKGIDARERMYAQQSKPEKYRLLGIPFILSCAHL
jgi:hypothetical protein